MVSPKDLPTQRVEGGNRDLSGLAGIQPTGQALPHFAGRLVGEGDGSYFLRRHSHLLHQVGDFLNDDAGLAAPGAGQHQQWTFCIGHRSALLVIELNGVCRHEAGEFTARTAPAITGFSIYKFRFSIGFGPAALQSRVEYRPSKI